MRLLSKYISMRSGVGQNENKLLILLHPYEQPIRLNLVPHVLSCSIKSSTSVAEYT